MGERLFLLNIKLLDITPEIYRHFIVPASITLDRLHDVIQIVMGWKDAHLHGFNIAMKSYTENPQTTEEGAHEGLFRLIDLIEESGKSFEYLYDFGDCWQHEITIMDNRYSRTDLQGPLECIEGTGACPPEDVGGVPGYYEFCEAWKNPGHEKHTHYKEWYAGFPWYDEYFDMDTYPLEKVNAELLKFLRWSRERFEPWFRRHDKEASENNKIFSVENI